MSTKAETKITQDIIAHIKSLGGDAFHVHGSALQRGGEPDISGEVQVKHTRLWRHLKVEVKTPEGEPSERQLYRLRHYHDKGYVAGVVTSIRELDELLDAYYVYWHGSRLLLDKLPYAKDIYS